MNEEVTSQEAAETVLRRMLDQHGTPEPAKAPAPEADAFKKRAALSAIEYTLDGFLSAGTTYIAGGHGIGKSSMLIPLASIVAGELYSDIFAELHRKVIFITEDPDQAHRVRYGLKKHNNLEERGNFAIFRAHRRTPLEVRKFIEWAEKHYTVTGPMGYQVRPLIVWDTTNACFKVENENDAAVVGEFMEALKTGGCNWIIGHLAKAMMRADFEDMAGRGSSAWEADAQCTAFIFANDKTTNLRHIGTKKVRFEPTCRELKFESHLDRETVTTPWGTTQVVPFRYGVPVRSSREEREAITEKIKEADKRIKTSKAIEAVVTFMWGKKPMGKDDIHKTLDGELKRDTVRDAVNALIVRGDIVEKLDYVAGNGKTYRTGIALKETWKPEDSQP